MQNNLDRFQKLLRGKDLDAFVVTNPVNIFYLCGFSGISQTERESFLVFTKTPTLIAPRLYQNEANALSSKTLNVDIAKERDQLFAKIIELVKNKKNIGFEKNDLKFSEYECLKKNLVGKLLPQENLVESLRITKSEDEIGKIKKAQQISQNAFGRLIPTIKIGQSEKEIEETLARIIKSLGGHGLAFESIVASGANSSKPHHKTSNRKIKKGEVLLLDFGAKYQNYCADLTRVVFLKSTSDAQRNVFQNVKQAQHHAISKIQKGTKTKDAFNFANEHFISLGLEEFFTHGLGHGIGLELHESPYLRAKTEDELGENMVFSIEPGLYLNWGGVRIEDLVVIKNGKAQVLGKIQEDIIQV